MSNKGLKERIAIRNTEIICYERDYIGEQGKSRKDSMEMVLYGMEPNNKVGFEDLQP